MGSILLLVASKNMFSKNIISNKPVFNFIESKDFYENYYNEPDSFILDLRNYKNYKKSHISRAVHFDVNSLFETYEGIPRKIKQVDSLIYTLSNAGISVYGTVGIYSDVLEDAFVLTGILNLLRVEKVYIIKDKFEGWVKNKLPVSNKVSIVQKGYFPYKISVSFYDSVIWSLDKVYKNMDNYSLVAVSENKIPLIAKSIFVKPKFDFDRYVLGSYYNSYDISRDKRIILYGDDNYEVLQVYFVLKVFLEYPNVVIFNGGINEWVARNLPTN